MNNTQKILFLFLIGLFGYAKPQQDNQYFFNSQNQQQGRFVPLYQPRQNNFFSSTGLGFHQLHSNNHINNNHDSSPGSYQEQILFVEPTSTSPSDESFNQYSSTVSPDYSDLSPRPFGNPFKSFGSQSTPLRNAVRPNGNFGVIQQKVRTNVPHEQNQFLARFNEKKTTPDNYNTNLTSQSSRGGRPITSSFSRPRPGFGVQPKPTVAPDDNSLASPQQLPFRVNRNRFQPNSERSTTTTTTQAPTTEKVSRYNRFGNSRSQQTKEQKPFQSQRISSTTTIKPKLNRNQYQPKRPIFVSREINEPVDLKPLNLKPRVPFGKLNSPLFSKQENIKKDEEKKLEEEKKLDEEEKFNDDIEYDNQVNDEKISDEPKEEIVEDTFEKLPLKEENATLINEDKLVENLPEISNITDNQDFDEKNDTNLENTEDEDHVILTSNFFLPDVKENASEEQSSAEVLVKQEQNETESNEEHLGTEQAKLPIEILMEKNNDTKIHDYEYEYEEEDPTENPNSSTGNPVESLITTTEKEFIQATTFRRNFDRFTESQFAGKVSPRPDNDELDKTLDIDSIKLNNSNDQIDKKDPLNQTIENTLENNENAEDLNLETVPTTIATLQEKEVSESVPTDYEDEYESDKLEGSGDYDDEEEGDEEEDDEESVQSKPDDILSHHVVSVVTTKSVVNGSSSVGSNPVLPDEIETTEETETELSSVKSEINSSTPESVISEQKTQEESVNNTTEGYVVIASIQTSRSINGARFLPFPAIEQEEKKQTLSELEKKIHQPRVTKKPKNSEETIESLNTLSDDSITTLQPVDLSSTEKNIPNQSTESIIDKLDGIQSELSSGFLSGKFPILRKMSEIESSTKATINVTTSSKFLPNIRKFVPKSSVASSTTSAPTAKPKINIEHLPQDEITEALLPTGFKERVGYKNRKLTTTEKTLPAVKIQHDKKPARNFTIGRSFKSKPAVQEISIESLLPKDFKLNETIIEEIKPNISDILSKVKFQETVDKFLPKDYKEKNSKTTTSKPQITDDDVSKFLPPGYKLRSTTTSKPRITEDDVSKFLPAGYKFRPSSTTSKPQITEDDVSKFLPPGYKLRSTRPTTTEKPKLPVIPVIPVNDGLSKFLPPGYKADDKSETAESIDISKLLTQQKVVPITDISALLPPGFKPEDYNIEDKILESSVSETTSKTDAVSKIVFPKSLNKKPRLTTPKPHGQSGGPPPPAINIKKGPPTRATTEFTGWPTPSTTPISIEKLLEQARTATIDIADLLPSSTSTTTTTTTTTTTPEPPKPTQPGHCRHECDLAGTIKIIDGVTWTPELLDHNTIEWKTLAKEVEAQLNEVYSNAPSLKQWYKKIRIDSFSKGSVLVDYFVELSNITRDINTLEVKNLFHEALAPAPLNVVPLQNSSDSKDYKEGKGEKLVKEIYSLGQFVVDPVATDFIVLPKSYSPTIDFAENDILIPQWAIALIVIGVGSLCFIIIFGVTVLLNRHKSSKKTPTPLTADMLNELNKNHMGGVDNYGADDFYNVDDAWNDTKQPIKPKRFTNSMNGGSSNSNIYDSWRSIHHGDYYYDQHNYTPHHHPAVNYNNKFDPYAAPDPFSDVHQMYTYNNQRSRYHHKDHYDPDF